MRATILNRSEPGRRRLPKGIDIVVTGTLLAATAAANNPGAITGLGGAIAVAFAFMGYRRADACGRSGLLWAVICGLTGLVGLGILYFVSRNDLRKIGPPPSSSDGLVVSLDEQAAAAERLKRR
jgi:hypothetical protein